jgi:hypothetical protein
MAAKVGDVFNYPGTSSEPTYSNSSGWHIHIVVKIDESRGDAYLVPLSTSIYWDSACEINVNDGCPFVTKRCFVSYVDGKKTPLDTIQKVARMGGPAPKELLARVIAGVGTSRRSQEWFRDAICPPARRVGRILSGNS